MQAVPNVQSRRRPSYSMTACSRGWYYPEGATTSSAKSSGWYFTLATSTPISARVHPSAISESCPGARALAPLLC